MKDAAMDHQPPVHGEVEQHSTSLGPDERMSGDLAGLSLVELQVLHSRICRQLDYEYLTDPGPHPLTMDRHGDLVDELDARCAAAGDVVP